MASVSVWRDRGSWCSGPADAAAGGAHVRAGRAFLCHSGDCGRRAALRRYGRSPCAFNLQQPLNAPLFNLTLVHADPSVIRKYANVTVPPKLFSVALDLQTTVPTTGRARLVVPYLEMDGAVAATSAVFPHGYRIPLELPLAVPSAAWFTVAAMFTTADGLSQKAPLEPFYVAFPDLLVPAAPAEVRIRRGRNHVLRMHADQPWRTAPLAIAVAAGVGRCTLEALCGHVVPVWGALPLRGRRRTSPDRGGRRGGERHCGVDAAGGGI